VAPRIIPITAVQKRPDEGRLRVVFEQERIVAVVAGDLAIRDRPARGARGLGGSLEVAGRIEPVRREGQEEVVRFAGRERVAQRAAGRGD